MHGTLDGDLLAHCPTANDEDAVKIFNFQGCHISPRRPNSSGEPSQTEHVALELAKLQRQSLGRT